MLKSIADGLVSEANANGLAILNGENAILGSRIKDATICGTMISIASETMLPTGNGRFIRGSTEYAVFPHHGKAAHINSDGQGTKAEFGERAREFTGALRDSY